MEWLGNDKSFPVTSCKIAEKENGGKNDKNMENMTSGLFILRLSQHISMVLWNKKASCFTQTIEGLVCLDKSTVLSGCFFSHQNLKKNVWMFYTFDQQTLIGGCYFKHSNRVDKLIFFQFKLNSLVSSLFFKNADVHKGSGVPALRTCTNKG